MSFFFLKLKNKYLSRGDYVHKLNPPGTLTYRLCFFCIYLHVDRLSQGAGEHATGMMETDWERWNAMTPPTSWLNDWNEPYSEIYDWHPWMRKFYSQREIDIDCLAVSGVSLSALRVRKREVHEGEIFHALDVAAAVKGRRCRAWDHVALPDTDEEGRERERRDRRSTQNMRGFVC